MQSVFIRWLAMLGCIGVLSGCGRSQPVPDAPKPSEAGVSVSDKPEPPSTPLPTGGTIKIGTLFSVTGPASFLGRPEARTAEMLVEKINQSGGIRGMELKLIAKDTGGSPEKAISFAKQLIEEDDVLAIIGPSTSGETMQIKALCESAGMILISCAAAEAIVNPIGKYIFKTPQKDSQAVEWILNSMKQKGIRRIGVVTSNDGYGAEGKKQLESIAPRHGIEIAISEVYDKAATDLTDIMTKIKGAQVEAVINWSIVPAQSIVPKNMRQIGMTVPLFQSHGFGNIKYVEQAGKAAEGILFPAGRLLIADMLMDDHPQKSVLTAYKTEYESRFKEPVSTFGGHAYDALMITVKAIEQVEKVDRPSVRAAIEKLTGFVGTAGVFNFTPDDHNGLGLDAFEMLEVRDGRFVPHITTE